MSRFLAAVALSVCLMTSAAIVNAQPAPAPMQTHQWSDQEDPHWHEYLKEKHKKDHDWAKASKREQRDYWKWRDKHPDEAH
jgi:hypothetical protein